jgi:GTPase SAR1 family protein
MAETFSVDMESPFSIIGDDTPCATYYTAAYQNTLQQGMKVPYDIFNIIASITKATPDANLERWQARAESLSAFRGGEPKIIGVLGNSGVGKSSIINSLLNVPELARTADIGEACTCVVTEFRQKKPEHTSRYYIEVQRLSDDQIHDLVRELVWSYRKLYLPGLDRNRMEREEIDRIENESKLAWSILETAFSRKEEFNEDMLQDQSDGAADEIAATLIAWTAELEWPENDGGEITLYRATAEEVHEIGELTDKFTEDSFWPFTKIIQVYLDAPLLKAGIVLADMPGLQDSNLARVQVTQKYLMDCDAVLVCVEIGRAVTNQALKDTMFDFLVKTFKCSKRKCNQAIVCTKIEDINPTAARRHLVGVGKNKYIDPKEIERLDRKITRAKESGSQALMEKRELERKSLLYRWAESVCKGRTTEGLRQTSRVLRL